MISLIFYSAAAILLIICFIKDRSLVVEVLKRSWKAFIKLLPQVSFVLLLMGFSLSILTPTIISRIIGEDSGLLGVMIAVSMGSITLIPSFISIPLGATLLESGAGLPQVAGFISSLMGVGVITFPMEKKYFGIKFAVIRNMGGLIMSIVFVILIALFLGVSL